MRIEIAEPGRMTQSGSSLLRLIQNNDMPILDLLVRESIQNSLDAYKQDASYVNIDFLTGNFEGKVLNQYLEGIEEALNEKYDGEQNKYIAIRDSNTKGLTGKLHYDEVENNEYGNLLKLVYEISKPQESPGAGGSWGLGKTVYFRVGIGLVVYYSRIINEVGEYESRLAISMIEDEKKSDSMIPSIIGKVKRGIAWWGEAIGENKTRPITDEQEIHEFLQVFNIKPYANDETGTTIIIPYIDEKALLNNNKISHEENIGEKAVPFWFNSIEEFIRVSVQRWYAPRLNNQYYKYGKWLRVRVNEQGITLDGMEPFSKIVQELYNTAINKDYKSEVLKCSAIERKSINLKNVLLTQEAGWVAYTKVNKELLKMNPPHNKLSPFLFINEENIDGDTNKPIVLFTRRPGMVVSYETSGAWTDSIPSSDKNEFIIGIFVLNSDNQLKGMGESIELEEYVRKSEMADHTSWSDWGNSQLNPRIINKVQGHVRNAIAKCYKEDENTNGNRLNSGLGKVLGDLLLPPENFGKKPSIGAKNPKGNTLVSKHKGALLKIDNDKIKYTSKGIQIAFKAVCPKSIGVLEIETYIAMESGKLSVQEWEKDLGQELPFEVSEIQINRIRCKENDLDEQNIEISSDNPRANITSATLEFKYSEMQIPYGLNIRLESRSTLEVEGTITIKAKEKNIRTLLNIYSDEGER